MPIVRQYGRISDIAKLAKLTGQQVAARRDYERRQEMLMRAQEAAQRQQLAQQQMKQQWALAQYEVATNARKQQMAMDWDAQKMALNSQFDFQMQKMKEQAYMERDLREELKEKDRYDSTVKKLKEHLADGTITKDEYGRAIVNLDLRYGGGYAMPAPRTTGSYLDLLPEEYRTELETRLKGEPTPATTPIPLTSVNDATGEKKVSYDGGKTWQHLGWVKKPPIGEKVKELPANIREAYLKAITPGPINYSR